MIRLLIILILSLSLVSCRNHENQKKIEKDSMVVAVTDSNGYGIVPWILACRVPGKGFGCFPGDSSFVTRTGMACEAFAMMGRMDAVKDKSTIISWIKSKQNSDGGYREADNYYRFERTGTPGNIEVKSYDDKDYYRKKVLPWGTDSALEPTYWALKTLKLLGAEPESPEKTAEFIGKLLLPEGVFSSYELGWNETRTKAMSYSTFWAVAALKELEEPVLDSAKVVEFLRQLQSPLDGPGGFRLGDLQFTIYNVQSCYYAVRGLKLLGSEPERPEDVRRFLLSSHGQETDGGFECGHGDDWNNYDHYSRTVDTYAAVKTLELLGCPLTNNDSSRAETPLTDCISWIKSVQNPDGGFARFGVTDQTPLRTPSEMAATWQAVSALSILGSDYPVPDNPVVASNEVRVHEMKYLYPTLSNSDPVDIWAYRRIALPIHEHFFEQTGSHIETIGYLSRWSRAAVSPMNAAFCTGGRSLIMHGFGQCAQMSLMLQQLAASVDYPARYTYTFGCAGGDVNCEILLREEGWDQAHWCHFIPFSNENIDPTLRTPEGKYNGWSALDANIDYKRNRRKLQFRSKTKLGDPCFLTVRIETVDYVTGEWTGEYKIDTTITYESELAQKLYPNKSW
jgi:hypothetical protein